MSINRNFSVSPVSATSERYRLPQKGTSGTLIEAKERLIDRVHGIPKEKSTVLRRIASSTLSRITEVDDEQSAASDQLVHHANLERFPSVQPLRNIRRKAGRLNLTSSSAATPATMMTVARDLFDEYGIDRPPG